MLTVYTTEGCAFCPMVKKYLTLKNIPFTSVDVTHDTEKRQELFNKTSMMSVPVTTDGTKYVVGWNPGELAKMISSLTAQAV